MVVITGLPLNKNKVEIAFVGFIAGERIEALSAERGAARWTLSSQLSGRRRAVTLPAPNACTRTRTRRPYQYHWFHNNHPLPPPTHAQAQVFEHYGPCVFATTFSTIDALVRFERRWRASKACPRLCLHHGPHEASPGGAITTICSLERASLTGAVSRPGWRARAREAEQSPRRIPPLANRRTDWRDAAERRGGSAFLGWRTGLTRTRPH